MKNQSVFKIALTGFIALCLSIFLVSQILDTAHSLSLWLLCLAIAFILLVGISHLLFWKIIWPRLIPYSSRQRVTWVIFCIFVGLFLVITIPLTVYPKVTLIHILATGEKNTQALGSEVWLAQIVEAKKTTWQSLADRCVGNWQQQKGMLVSSQNQPAELICAIKSEGNILLQFGTHPWSGIVQVKANDQIVQKDLYSDGGRLEDIAIAVRYTQQDKILNILFLFSDALSLGFLLLALTLSLVAYRGPRLLPVKHQQLSWFAYAGVIILSWGVYLAAFWPGFLSPDGVTQLSQVVSGRYYNWHPAIHTMTLWLLTRIAFSPAPVVITQILILGCLLGWGIQTIARKNAPQWLTWGLTLFFAFIPVTSLMVLTIWKDVAYSIALTAFTIMIFRIIMTKGSWLGKTNNLAALSIAGAFTALYRLNGMPVALGCMALVLAAYYRHWWKHILGSAFVVIAIWYAITGPLYKIVGVNTTDVNLGSNQAIPFTLSSIITQHQTSGTQMEPNEVAFLQAANIGGDKLNLKYLSSHQWDLIKYTINFTLRNPGVTLNFILSRTTFIFQIFQPPLSRYETVGTEIDENPFGLKSQSLAPGIQSVLNRVIGLTEKPELDWFFWRNAFWMYVLLYAVIITILRSGDWKYSLLIAPILLNALPLALFSGGQLSRYILPTLIIGPLFSLYLLFSIPSQDTEDKVR